MVQADFQQFSSMLDAVYGLHGKALAAEPKALFFRAMSSHSLAVVRAALDAHVRDPNRGQYPPKPADLMAQIVGAQSASRPGAEEAWAIAVKACDESETVVMNDEIAQAWGVAKPIFDLGDEVGARMAFREVYGRIAASSERPPAWWPSIGSDPHKRDAALIEARRQGLLPAPHVAGLLPPAVQVAESGGRGCPEGRRRFQEAMAEMQLKNEAKAEQAMREREHTMREREHKRKAESHRKAVIAERVAAYQAHTCEPQVSGHA